ncbi:MAG TPA: DUF3293 domain-containing protein [Solimonas sp.]
MSAGRTGTAPGEKPEAAPHSAPDATPDAKAAWEGAYRAAIYRVLLHDGALDLRIGLADPAADDRLWSVLHARHWALVTACNPRSRPLDDDENRQRQMELQQALATHRQPWHDAVHVDPAGQWPDEPSCLLIDPPLELPETLGRQFDQHAIVRGAQGAAPQLIWLTTSDKTGD